jgi:hypothetical protein
MLIREQDRAGQVSSRSSRPVARSLRRRSPSVPRSITTSPAGRRGWSAGVVHFARRGRPRRRPGLLPRHRPGSILGRVAVLASEVVVGIDASIVAVTRPLVGTPGGRPRPRLAAAGIVAGATEGASAGEPAAEGFGPSRPEIVNDPADRTRGPFEIDFGRLWRPRSRARRPRPVTAYSREGLRVNGVYRGSCADEFQHELSTRVLPSADVADLPWQSARCIEKIRELVMVGIAGVVGDDFSRIVGKRQTGARGSP